MRSSLLEFPDPVNETSARLVASGVVAMAGTSLAFDQPWLLAPLAYGFGARVLSGPRFSPLGQLATRVLTPRIPVEHRYSPGPPKRLAQGMGLTMTLGATAARLRGRRRLSAGLLGALVVAASLEAFAGYCVACRLFPLLIRAGLVPADACESCADIWSRPAETDETA